MRDRRLRLLGASCLCLLLTLPLRARAQQGEAVPVPPWGRELTEPAAEALPAGEPVAADAAPARRSFWFEMEYLLWWTRNGNTPPLVTRGEATDPRPGALDQPNTKLLFGGSAHDLNFEERHGARFTAGAPFGDDTYAVEASYFFLPGRTIGTQLNSPGSPILARPFYDVVNNRADSSLTAYPGLISGGIAIRATSFLQGAEANASAALWRGEQGRVALLAGVRYLNLNEDVSIAENDVGGPAALQFAGTTLQVRDRFATWNDFYGGQLGIRTEWDMGRWQLKLVGKVALGDSHERSQVRGRTVVNTGFPIDAPAGLLALASNSGSFTRDAFAVVPEVGLTLGLRVTERLTLFAGYSFLYWSDVARPGDQIDLGLNPNLIPTSNRYGTPGGPARPAAGVRGSDYWAQGLNLGLTFRY